MPAGQSRPIRYDNMSVPPNTEDQLQSPRKPRRRRASFAASSGSTAARSLLRLSIRRRPRWLDVSELHECAQVVPLNPHLDNLSVLHLQ
jgi:hypothetical protein